MSNENKGVKTEHINYIEHKSQWKRCRDVIAGQDAVHAASNSYLPKLRKQTPLDYASYLQRTPFYNASARTIDGLIGMLFRKQPQQTIPAGIVDLLKDVTLSGKPFDIFAQDICNECVSVGRVGILVDFVSSIDTGEQPLTVGLAERLGLRPTMQMYSTESIINWRFKLINNVWTLHQVVLAEQFSEPARDSLGNESEFENVSEPRWRVLDLENDNVYRVRIFRIDSQGKDQIVSTVYPFMNGKNLGFIPFLIITPDGTSFEIKEPPLIDLVDMNLSHYRTSADYEHGCHFTALPTLFISGYEQLVSDGSEVQAEIYLGSQAAITMSNPNAKAEFIEFTGQGLGALEKNLDRKEQQMAILGARMLATEGKQAQTATTTAIHRTGENSVLSAISIAVSLGLKKALTWFAEWASNAGECDYNINKDFLPITVDGATLTALIKTLQAGQLNKEEMFDWLQRADIIEAEVTYEEHLKGDFAELILPTNDNSTGNPPIKVPAE